MYNVTASFRLGPGAKANNLYIHQAWKLESRGEGRQWLAFSSDRAQNQRDESSLEISIA